MNHYLDDMFLLQARLMMHAQQVNCGQGFACRPWRADREVIDIED
jgi:hypothetical protein